LKYFVRSIPVEDASGARFKIHEYKILRSWEFGTVAKGRHFELETGETVEAMDPWIFRLASTGEPLMRLDC